MNHKPTVICLMGPTASGKTQLAVELVKRFPCEIISVDSVMVYQGMNIGAAKPSEELLKIAPHRLIDIRKPSDTYSAAAFREDALREIKDIVDKGNIPLLVGGTMLYFHALQQGLSELPSANPDIREKLDKEAAVVGWEIMHKRLQIVDPIAAKRIKPTDPQRIQRALEVYEITGEPLSDCWGAVQKDHAPYSFLNIGLIPRDRQILHECIAQRFTLMLEQGLIDEVKQLCQDSDVDAQTPAFRAVGYRQVLAFLKGELSYDDMSYKAIVATRQLAKRQLTWLRSWPDLHEIDSSNSRDINELPYLANLATLAQI